MGAQRISARGYQRVLWVASTIAFRLPDRALVLLEQVGALGQGKGWGAGTVECEARACLSLLPPPLHTSPVALDVGANVGTWTAALLACAPTATVYAFEPSRTAHARLAQRFAGLPQVVPVQSAVGRQHGTATLWSNQPGSSLASLTRRRVNSVGGDFTHAEQVDVVTLDEWRRGSGVSPTVLKLDVEGHEMDVLQSAEEVLKSARVVQFEFGACHLDRRVLFRDFFSFFAERDFSLFRLGPRGLTPVPRYLARDEVFQVTNYFAVRATGPTA